MSDDITTLILDDHEEFRRAFARLDDLSVRNDTHELAAVWEPLASHLDVHAIAEEEIFYPHLLRKGENAEEETLDAIGDHNDIRDGVREAQRHPVGSPEWWNGVGKARLANDEHMAEEEREGLADFRMNAPIGLREALGRRFRQFMAAHPDPSRLDNRDKDPEGYIEAVEREQGITRQDHHAPDGSLGIGSLKGRV